MCNGPAPDRRANGRGRVGLAELVPARSASDPEAAPRFRLVRWRRPGGDYQVRWQPFPDFVPANLFSDLSLPRPESYFRLLRQTPKSRRPRHRCSSSSDFAPGRVSRRYGVEHRYVRHWVPAAHPPLADLDLQAFADGIELGTFTFPARTVSSAIVSCVRGRSAPTSAAAPTGLDERNP